MRTPLIIPTETQTREFDAKLLLACEAAERGFTSVIGNRIEIHKSMHSFPRSIYLAKDFRISSRVMFDVLARLGHHIVALDEEALIFYNAQDYYEARVNDECLERVEHLFAWGPANERFMQAYPRLNGIPISVTGNPRVDLTRPELRAFYDPDVAQLRERYGDFLLINTNFGRLNHYLPDLRVVPGVQSQGPEGHAPMNAFTTEAWKFRAEMYEHFLALVPALADRFPEQHIVVRPHPSERHQTWHEAADGRKNVSVVHEGPVHPWLLAARAMIHNGCSTGLEAYLLDTASVAYEPIRSEDGAYDLDLTNDLSLRAGSRDELFGVLSGLLDGASHPTPTARQEANVNAVLAARTGPFAAERIADALDAFERTHELPRSSAGNRLHGRIKSQLRAAMKRRNAKIEGHKNSAAYTAHRFAGIELAGVEERMARLRKILLRFEGVQARTLLENVFEISPAR